MVQCVQKVGSVFQWRFLVFVRFFLTGSLCDFAPLRALRETKNFEPLCLRVKKIAFTRIRVSNPSYQKIPTKIYNSISNKMNVEEIRDFALSLADVTESFPFGPETIVFKTNNKIFLLLPLDEVDFLKINIKCNPELALELRLNYPDSVLPGYHMNKKHWNTVVIDGLLSWKSIKEMIDHSYGWLVGRKR